MGSDISEPRRYAAFISYAHADELMAARLHKALETYPVPKHLRAQGKATKPVFRDVAELTAAHSQAMRRSQFRYIAKDRLGCFPLRA